MRALRHRLAIALYAMAVFLAGARPTGAGELAEALDNYVIPIYPTVYGEIINAMPPDEVANISTALRGVEFFGYLKSMGDVANALDAGDNTEAAIETASTLAKGAISYAQYKGVQSIALAGSSVAMLPLTALVTAIDIARSSQKAVEASRIALELERLYGSVEYDRELRDRNRKLGEGDPIRINPDTIERLWRKVIYNEQWAALFKTYVTNELGQPWPEPTLWERISVPSDVLRDAKLMEDQTRLKSHIASLLIELNKVAKKQEARVVLAQQLRELSAAALKVDPAQLQEAISRFFYALGMLPAIRDYANALPAKIDGFAKTIETGGAAAIMETRQLMLVEAGLIVEHVKVIRAIPENNPRAGSERVAVFRSLSDGYQRLWAMLDTSSATLINSRLVEDARALTVAGTEFVFTRHPVEKTFDDYAQGFRDAVRNGSSQAGALVGAARTAVVEERDKIRALYAEDFEPNKVLFTEKLAELDARLQALSEQLAATSDQRQRNELRAAVQSLQKQRGDLLARWEKYQSLHTLTAGIDVDLLDGILEDIDQFVTANDNRYAVVEETLGKFFADASRKLDDFFIQRSPSPKSNQSFFDDAELDRLAEIIADNPGGYVGIAPDFLAQHASAIPAGGSRAQAIVDTLDVMAKAIRHQIAVVNGHRMPWFVSWEMATLPSLESMGSPSTAAALDNVEAAIQAALREHRGTPLGSLRQAYKETHASHLQRLEGMLESVKRTRSRATKADGLAGRLKAYLQRAKANNERVEADDAFLGTLYGVFNTGRGRLQPLVVIFHAKASHRFDPAAGVAPAILPSRDLLAALDSTERMTVLEYSRKTGLGIETFFAEPFVELATSVGGVTITITDLDTLRTRVDRLPTSDYATFQGAMTKLMDESESNTLLLKWSRVESFVAQFAFDERMKAAMDRLAKSLKQATEAAGANQRVIDDAAQRFDLVLAKVNAGLVMAEEAAAADDHATVAGLAYHLATLWNEYESLGARRADVDAAFAKFRVLVEEAKAWIAEHTAEEPVAALPDNAAIQRLYQDFIDAYGRGDLRGLLALLAPDWRGGDGADVRDVEEYLTNSFRVFDRIQYRISGFSSQPVGDRVQVSYGVRITGENRRQRLTHEEQSQVIEEVGLLDGKPVILRTLSGSQWLK